MFDKYITFLLLIFIFNFAFDVIENLCSAVQINFRLKKGSGNELSMPTRWKHF